MYAWIWRHLPGPRWVRVLEYAVIVVAFFAILFTWVYPWLEPNLPFQHNTIGD